MISLVIGGSASGKSAYAEKLACNLAKKRERDCEAPEELRKYYVATMEHSGEEATARVKKHRNMRRGKGFCTIECPRDVGALAGQKRLEDSVVLLECMSNLVANEMFDFQNPLSPEQIPEHILSGILSLEGKAEHLIIVTNDVFGDGCIYDESTMTYLKVLGEVNQLLASVAQEVIEVVYSVPCVIKR